MEDMLSGKGTNSLNTLKIGWHPQSPFQDALLARDSLEAQAVACCDS